MKVDRHVGGQGRKFCLIDVLVAGVLEEVHGESMILKKWRRRDPFLSLIFIPLAFC